MSYPKYINTIIKSEKDFRLHTCKGLDFFDHPKSLVGDIHLDNNDYLSIANKIRIESNLNATLMSSAYLGNDSPHRTFEIEMAAFLGTEEVFLCQSGYVANLGLLQCICDRNYPVYIDESAHVSLFEGVYRGRPKAIHKFAHNNTDELANLLSLHGSGIIVIDSVYSTNGVLANLNEINTLALQYDSLLVVDESHSLGTHGDGGRGICSILTDERAPLIITASLSKAFAGRGGIVACPRNFLDFLRSRSYPSIFSSAVQGYEVEAFRQSLALVKAANEERFQLWRNVSLFRRALDKFCSIAGTEQIISIEMDGPYEVLKLRNDLAKEGIFAAPFIPPAARKGFLRFSINAGGSFSELNKVVLTLKKLL